MPIKKSAYKELRKAETRHFVNISTLSELRTLSKRLEKLVSEKKIDEAKALSVALFSKIDKAASKGVIHKNTAARKISRLMKRLLLAKA